MQAQICVGMWSVLSAPTMVGYLSIMSIAGTLMKESYFVHDIGMSVWSLGVLDVKKYVS